jgi:hypothetical protein
MLLLPGDYHNIVDGMVFEITDEELARADEYEAEMYKRGACTNKIRRKGLGLYTGRSGVYAAMIARLLLVIEHTNE